MLNRVGSLEATTVFDTSTLEYPITMPMIGLGQMSRLNVRCLPIYNM